MQSQFSETKVLDPRRPMARKLDKLFTLINYALSSSEKALRYINLANFEAEFAVKLFKSDKDNLIH